MRVWPALPLRAEVNTEVDPVVAGAVGGDSIDRILNPHPGHQASRVAVTSTPQRAQNRRGYCRGRDAPREVPPSQCRQERAPFKIVMLQYGHRVIVMDYDPRGP